MLNDRLRAILSWITIGVVVAVVVTGMVSVVSLIRPGQGSSSLQVLPAEVAVCPGEDVVFSTDPSTERVEWAATGGGEMSPDGRYVAGQPGDYEVQAAGSGGTRGRAVVHVLVCTPTPPPPPSPTPAPTLPPTPTPFPISEADPQGDVGAYSTGIVMSGSPAAVDIRNASVSSDLHVALGPASGLPTPLAGWAQEGEIVLWIALYGPPSGDTLASAVDWLIVLDVDGNTATGRPPGTRSINPDLGDEVALGLSYDPISDGFSSFLWVWNSSVGDWDTTDRQSSIRHIIDEDNSVLGLAVSSEYLVQQLNQYSGVAISLESVRGRAAAIAYTSPELSIDFYPDPP